MVKLIFTSEYTNLLVLVYGLLVLLYFYSKKKKKDRAIRFGNFETLEKITEGSLIDAGRVLLIIHLLAITGLVVAISNPVLVEKVNTTKSDYVIALDSSASMFTEDINPSRFEAAKQISSDFVSEIGNKSSIGIVSYSGKAKKVTKGLVPAAKAPIFIKRVEMGGTAGTAIGDAIVSSVNLLMNSSKPRKIILITDGKNNAGVSLNESIDLAVRHNVSIYPVGIGKNSSSNGEKYEMVEGVNASRADFPNIDKGSLERIANLTKGEEVFVANRTEMEKAFDMRKTETEYRTDISQYFGIFGILMLLLEWILKTTSYSSLP